MHEIEKLYKEIQPKIYAYFYLKSSDRTIAEDLTHDVFFEAMKSLHSFSGNSSLQTWIFSIAKNLLRKYYRSKKYKQSLEEKLKNNDAFMTSPEEQLILKEENHSLINQLHQLDELSREIVTLRIYGELSFKEIGHLVEKSENYVRVHFHRTKLRLQKEMRARNG